jgi:hypothetical protein
MRRLSENDRVAGDGIVEDNGMSANTGEKQGGRFQKGHSGNPRGKPREARHRSTLAAEVLLDGEAEQLTRKAVELALGGDTTALRLCLDRIIPPRRERPVSLPLRRTVSVLLQPQSQ